MAIVMDEYSCHIQSDVLELFRANRILCVTLPSHSSHRPQPLDVSLFALYKSALQSEMHRVSRHVNVLDVFTAAEVIASAYGRSVTYTNIVNGFEHTSLWVRREGGPSSKPLTFLFHTAGRKISVDELMASFDKTTRALVSGDNFIEGGTVKIDKSLGVNLTCEAVLRALRLRAARRKK